MPLSGGNCDSQRSAGGQELHPSEVYSSSRRLRASPLTALQVAA
jgi:hypothetical protein